MPCATDRCETLRWQPHFHQLHPAAGFGRCSSQAQNGGCTGRTDGRVTAAMLQSRLWNRCDGISMSESRRSFELPSDSKWIGFSSEGKDPCHLPHLPLLRASGKLSQERARRRDRSRKRAASVRSKQRLASKPRLVRPRAAGRVEWERDDLRPKSSLSELSLPSPRDSRDNDDMLSASAVLRAALTGSFLDDESVDLQMSDPPYAWSPYSSSQDENHDSKCVSSPPWDFDGATLAPTNLMRCAFQRERPPLSTLQLLGLLSRV